MCFQTLPKLCVSGDLCYSGRCKLCVCVSETWCAAWRGAALRGAVDSAAGQSQCSQCRHNAAPVVVPPATVASRGPSPPATVAEVIDTPTLTQFRQPIIGLLVAGLQSHQYQRLVQFHSPIYFCAQQPETLTRCGAVAPTTPKRYVAVGVGHFCQPYGHTHQ